MSDAGRDPAGRWSLGWAVPLLGLCSTVVIVLAAPELVGSGGVRWWYELHIPPGRAGGTIAFYLGCAGLILAWMLLGRRITREAAVPPHELAIVGCLWAAPLLAGPALFSSDMYSYLAQGAILHAGLDPYKVSPEVLSHLGDHALFDAVSPFWRTTTAPYGPLFIGIASLVVGVTGEHLVAGIVVMHAVEMIGVVLLAVFTPQLARLCGADPARATWLVLPCPLVLLQLVAAGHNDALMAGLMVAGVTCALRARPLTGIACCALAATVKVPAGIAALFLIAALARESDGLKAQLAVVAKGVASAVAVAVAVSVATGLGTGWISSSVLSTPGKVHLSVTPVTEIGYTIARILSAVNVHVDAHRLESHVGDVAIVVVAAFVAWCAWHARRDNLVVLLAASLFVIALGGPAAWPWYFCWSLVLAAAIPDVQRALLLGVAVALSPLLVKADGILAIPLEYAPLVLACWLALAGSSWHRARRDSVILAALHRPAPHP